MADKIKQLIHPLVPTTLTTTYTVPNGKYTVVKSIVIANYNATEFTFTLRIGGASIADSRVLKGFDTLVIKDLDIPLLPSEIIQVQASGSCLMYISGYERDYSEANYPYTKVNVLTTLNEDSTTWESDMILKSIIVHNSNGSSGNTSTTATIRVGAPWPFIKKDIKAKDSLIIPDLNLFLGKGTRLTYMSESPWNVKVTFILEKVVQ